MENLSVHNLIELLKSHLDLLGELEAILNNEREAVVSWKVTDTRELMLEKEKLIRKQQILDEARKTLSSKIMSDLGAEDSTISSIIKACQNDEQSDELSRLKDILTTQAKSLEEANTSMKVLYNSNIRMIREIYERFGYAPTDNYGTTKPAYTKSSSIVALG